MPYFDYKITNNKKTILLSFECETLEESKKLVGIATSDMKNPKIELERSFTGQRTIGKWFGEK
ncbi:MAG: hypothetical protein RBQ91_02280 [Acholeplasma sp.]|nr:hypothetical protein [Acholeplasma sp.]